MISLLKLLIKQIFGMVETKENMEEKLYVWIKSERSGDIVTIDVNKDDKKWLYFTDGTRLAKDLIGEFLMETGNEEDAQRISKSFNPVETQVESPKVEEVKPKPESKAQAPTEMDDNNVMMGMLKKVSKKNTAKMPVTVNLPSKAMHGMLIDEMDVDASELNNYIIALIESQIDNLRDQLKGQIESFTNNYYNDRKRSSKSDSGE